MALFKILKGNKSSLPSNKVDGYCYVTLDEHKMYIDYEKSDNTLDRFTLDAAQADTLKITRTINGMQFNGSKNINNYGVCSTEAGTAEKVVTVGSDFTLTAGAQVVVKFTNANTASNPTLNVNEKGAKPIYQYGTTAVAGTSNVTGWRAGAVQTFTYDGTGWIRDYWSNSTYSGEKGISLNNGKFGHSNTAIAADSIGAEQTPSFGGTFDIPKITYDDYGHITAATTVQVTLPNVATDDFLPLAAGENKKLTGPLGLTSDVMYGTTLPESGFNGQLFFLEDSGTASLPVGGSAGQVLVKNTATDGDASWKEIVALPKGGSTDQILVKNSTTDGDASWKQAGYLPLTGGTITGGLVLNSQDYVDPVGQNFAIVIEGSDSADVSGVTVNNSTQGIALYLSPSGYMGLADSVGNGIVYKTPQGHYHLGPSGVYSNGSVLFGAVQNDYAEYRSQKEAIKPGYCVASSNNGQVYKTTEKFQACDGIVSDTFGFAIGETDKCKTPLAVAGRVLAYFHGNREDYQSGDTVCAGPEGKVMKMTREEIKEYPDRIIGIVSEIPEYETWGSGNVEVNNRIWIKVK